MMQTRTLGTIRRTLSNFPKLFSTQAQPEERLEIFRANENDPAKHTVSHIGQFYKIPPKERHVFLYGGLPKLYETQTRTFNETCLMVRKPALNIIHTLKTLDYTKPTVRMVLYGKHGSGKSLTLAHVLHYAHNSGFLVIHVPWVKDWMWMWKDKRGRKPDPVSPAAWKEGYFDLNLNAAAWLVHFKSQNEHLLSNPALVTSEDHVWNNREKLTKGAPLTELIDFAVSRITFASRCVVILAEEIKKLTISGHCKTLVAVDGYNAFFSPKTKLVAERKEIIPPQKVTLTEAFVSLTKTDWNNAAVVVTVDHQAVIDEYRESYLPRYLLGKAGFEHLDPFIPILVDQYSSKELKSVMDYYRERKWIVPVAKQDEELAFISNANPLKLMELCNSL